MTVALGVLVSDGLVLAADSRTTYGNPRGWPKVASDYTQKVFPITNYVAAATAGWAILNHRTINSLATDFARGRNPNDRIDAVLPDFLDYFEGQYNSHVAAGFDPPVDQGRIAFGFVVGGYAEDGVGHLYECGIPGRICTHHATTASPGAVWIGQTDIIKRMIWGIDPRFDRTGLTPEVNQRLDRLALILYFARMNPQDAIDFAQFIIRTTIDAQRFSDGIIMAPGDVPGVGGSIDIGFVTSTEGFTWINRKTLGTQHD